MQFSPFVASLIEALSLAGIFEVLEFAKLDCFEN